jgi:hypothetical protein
VTFIEACGGPGAPGEPYRVGRCLWPLDGAGAEMVVCGDVRDLDCAYCPPHRDLAAAEAKKKLRPFVPTARL